jgi:hypothetical protein
MIGGHKMTRSQVGRIAIALVCATALGYSEAPSKGQAHRASEARVKIAENECYPKGGLGIINKDLYIDLRSKNNELIVAEGKRWAGAATSTRQVVFVLGSRVVSGADIPADFSLENSALVSFEGNKISFLDFKSGIGGFYQRIEGKQIDFTK